MRNYFVLFSLLITFPTLGNATVSIAEVNQATRHLDLTPHIQVFIDNEHAYSIEDIINNEKLEFIDLTESGNSFGFSKSVYWIKFSIIVAEPLQKALLLEYKYPLLDKLTFFFPDSSGNLKKTTTGDSLPFIKRELDYRSYLFHLYPVTGQQQTYYMRLETEGSMQIPVSLWIASDFIEHVDFVNISIGIYYGIMMLLIFVAFVAFLFLRNVLYLYYSLYLLSFLMFQFSVDGFSYQYLWPDLPQWTSRATVFFIGTSVFFAMLFTGSFLRIWNYHQYIKWLFFLTMGLAIVSMFLSVFGNYAFAVKLAAFTGVLIPPVILLGSFSSIKKGYKPALILLSGWSIYLIGVYISGLVYLGLIESYFFTRNSVQLASVVEVLLLGYALIEQVRVLNRDKESATVSANKYLRQLNEGLESQVAERTRELKEKNDLLSDLALHDSMTGLLNHNASIKQLKIMTSTALRYERDLAVVMIDIDHFKQINDQYGHPAGDTVIVAIANILKNSLRESDGCGRYGGEEFILLLPETQGEYALELAESIRLKIMEIKIDEVDEKQLSASFGIAAFDRENSTADIICDADKALYKAKENGRNQVVLL